MGNTHPLNFDTRSKLSSARHKPLRSVGFRAQSIHLNCKRKSRPRSRNFPTFLTSRAGTFNTWVMSLCSSWKEEDLFKHFEKSLKNSKMLRNWSDESLKCSSFFQTIFRSVCLGLLIDLFQTAENPNLKVLLPELGAGATGLTLGLVFWAFAQLPFLSINH